MRFAAILTTLASLATSTGALAGDIAGTVYDAQGLPVADAPVQLANGERVSITAEDGTFRFADVAAGEAELAVLLADGALQRVWVDVDGEGESRRNIFLLSVAGVDRALTAALQPEMPLGAMEQTFELAERMTRESAAREAQDWRWSDLEG